MSEKCTAKSKQSGERCKRSPSKGRSVCRMHGGFSPRGVASARFKHGRYSKDLPKDLLATFEASLGDKELLELEREVSLVDARVAQLLRNLNDGASVAAWNEAVFSFRAYKRGLLKRDRQASDDAFARLDDILERQSEEYRSWQEVKELVSLRRKLSDSQSKRQERLGRFVETQKITVLLSALTDALRQEIRNPEILRRVGTRFSEILDGYESETLLLPPAPEKQPR